MKILIVLLLVTLTNATESSYREVLLKRLRSDYADVNMVKNLMCLAHHASGYNPDYINNEHHGLFALSGSTWCQSDCGHSENKCNMLCSDMRKNLSHSLKCVAMVLKYQGFDDWGVYKAHCANKNLDEYLTCA